MIFKKEELIKSPLNYTGGKYDLLPQILPFIPENINTFVDLFCGGCNVGININSNKVVFNDIRTPIIDMYNELKNMTSQIGVNETILYIENRIKEYNLTNQNKEQFLLFKEKYNNSKYPIDLFILSCFSFSNYINFNSDMQFNSSFGKRRYNKNTKIRLEKFLNKMEKYNFQSFNFINLNVNKLTKDDFVYLDPPYLITNSDYNKLWTELEEKNMIYLLDKLNEKNIKFALSNVLEHKDKENKILKEWSKKYNVNILDFQYDGCTYQKENTKTYSKEVLITNY